MDVTKEVITIEKEETTVTIQHSTATAMVASSLPTEPNTTNPEAPSQLVPVPVPSPNTNAASASHQDVQQPPSSVPLPQATSASANVQIVSQPEPRCSSQTLDPAAFDGSGEEHTPRGTLAGWHIPKVPGAPRPNQSSRNRDRDERPRQGRQGRPEERPMEARENESQPQTSGGRRNDRSEPSYRQQPSRGGSNRGRLADTHGYSQHGSRLPDSSALMQYPNDSDPYGYHGSQYGNTSGQYIHPARSAHESFRPRGHETMHEYAPRPGHSQENMGMGGSNVPGIPQHEQNPLVPPEAARAEYAARVAQDVDDAASQAVPSAPISSMHLLPNQPQGEPAGIQSGPARQQTSQPPRVGGHISSQTPGGGVHDEWVPNYQHTSKCDGCNQNCKDVTQRCDICSRQYCRKCFEAGKLDPRHVEPVGGFNWNRPANFNKRKASSEGPDSARKRIAHDDPEDDEPEDDEDYYTPRRISAHQPSGYRPRPMQDDNADLGGMNSPSRSQNPRPGNSQVPSTSRPAQNPRPGNLQAPGVSRPAQNPRPENLQAQGGARPAPQNPVNRPRMQTSQELDLGQVNTMADMIALVERASRVRLNPANERGLNDSFDADPTLERIRARDGVNGEGNAESLFVTARSMMRIVLARQTLERRERRQNRN